MILVGIIIISGEKYFLKPDLGFVNDIGFIYLIVCCFILALLILQAVFVKGPCP